MFVQFLCSERTWPNTCLGFFTVAGFNIANPWLLNPSSSDQQFLRDIEHVLSYLQARQLLLDSPKDRIVQSAIAENKIHTLHIKNRPPQPPWSFRFWNAVWIVQQLSRHFITAVTIFEAFSSLYPCYREG